MPAARMHDAGHELTAYSPQAAVGVDDRVDALVPPAYVRLPLPLQETHAYHAAPAAAEFDGVVMRPKERLEFLLEREEVDTKRALLSGLAGQPAHSTGPSSFSSSSPSAAAAAAAPNAEDAVASRVLGSLCDASHVTSSQLMGQLVSHVLLSRTSPTRVEAGCIATVDLNHTVLGSVGRDGPLPSRDAHGDDICQFPDERRGRRKTRLAKLREAALRSRALAYAAPLLWVPGCGRFQVTRLVCHHCCLGDPDAEALAFILRKRRAAGYVCFLEYVDLSFNNITDDGAAALKKAIKYNKRIQKLFLLGNEGLQKMEILESIQRRLKRNQEGRANWTLLQHLKWVIKGY
ncbi:uncharacterized protein Tco025E_07046 [Trypanosoma conorhini]|uniref:Uncharacterized protein n=1 Tax=Trypanosoma conorhini TaxID=83891 RepID=A0A3R7MPQ3_9TRYP|nr:uncharacterized protein Tco025E_07046 [Trypanosoma conorhini]RNF09276.1 hypothetical protein Tco025E_07046 [Trypanosoma conorhini]